MIQNESDKEEQIQIWTENVHRARIELDREVENIASPGTNTGGLARAIDELIQIHLRRLIVRSWTPPFNPQSPEHPDSKGD